MASHNVAHNLRDAKAERDCDVESGRTESHSNSQANLNAGAPLNRQISVQLSNEQYERLFLQTGGVGASKGDAAKRFGNPTPLGLASFLLCLTPFACNLMGFAGTTSSAAATTVGAFYFIGGVGSYVAGILEWVLGNTFPATVFCTFGGLWLSFAFLLSPTEGIAQALGPTSVDYNAGIALFFVWWAVLTLIYLMAALRTNLVFVMVFFFLDIAFWLLVATYFCVAKGLVAKIPMLLQASGAFCFLTAACGWYLMLVLTLGATGFPLALPVGDMSGFLARKPKQS
ncbi:hypothetical protein OIO90_003364 [Microbotryomycetes sp. JL221]|nr:hypothetical protein OIO90_003364 [Microbotryomycetes sp. JL221]